MGRGLESLRMMNAFMGPAALVRDMSPARPVPPPPDVPPPPAAPVAPVAPVPKTVPLHHRMRCAQKAKKGPPQKGIENCDSGNSAPPSEELKAAQPEPKRRRFKQAEDAPRLPLQEIRQASRKSAEDGR
eukprot:s2477_g9.t1